MPIPRPEREVPLSNKAKWQGRAIAFLMRAWSLTLRFEVEDRAGVMESPPSGSLLWCFWHNRLFVMPTIYRRFLPERSGAVLTSPSRDGAIIAATMRCFGAASVRGSSSKRGSAALRELVSWVDEGYDVAFTPDGPRGPRYQLAPGVIGLAQRTETPILPIRVEYGSAWKFQKAWDHFRLPKPFSRVKVIFEPYETIDPDAEDDRFEAERARVERVLNPDHETD